MPTTKKTDYGLHNTEEDGRTSNDWNNCVLICSENLCAGGFLLKIEHIKWWLTHFPRQIGDVLCTMQEQGIVKLSPAHSCKLKGLLILFAKGPLKAHHVPTTPWQMISMNCNTSNWIIALIYSIFAMFGRTAFELAFQSVGMLSVIWSSELQTSWSMVFQFLQTWCCVADSKAKAFARAIGVHNILIHSNKKLTMQGLKVNAYSSVSVIGREHF